MALSYCQNVRKVLDKLLRETDGYDIKLFFDVVTIGKDINGGIVRFF